MLKEILKLLIVIGIELFFVIEYKVIDYGFVDIEFLKLCLKF